MSEDNLNTKDSKCDDKVDAIAAVLLISAFVVGAIYWLITMPS